MLFIAAGWWGDDAWAVEGCARGGEAGCFGTVLVGRKGGRHCGRMCWQAGTLSWVCGEQCVCVGEMLVGLMELCCDVMRWQGCELERVPRLGREVEGRINLVYHHSYRAACWRRLTTYLAYAGPMIICIDSYVPT